MELNYLRDFLSLERTRNFTRTAEEREITEASLSRHIKSLEAYLGRSLFYRTTRSVELTEFGEQYLYYATRIVQMMDECDNALRLDKNKDLQRLMIGIGAVSNYGFLNETLHRFSADNPECVVGTILGDNVQLKEGLCRQEYEMVILWEDSPFYDDMYERLNILHEPLCVTVPKSDPLSELERIDVALLKEHEIMIPSENMLSYRLFSKACRADGFEPKVTLMAKTQGFFQPFVNAGSGITILCKSIALGSVNNETQVVRELTPTINEYINLLYLKKGMLSEPAKRAVQCFRDTVKINEQSSI